MTAQPVVAAIAREAAKASSVREMRDLGNDQYDFVGKAGKRIRIGANADGSGIVIYSPDAAYSARTLSDPAGIIATIAIGVQRINREPGKRTRSGEPVEKIGSGMYRVKCKGGDYFIERGVEGGPSSHPWAVGRRYGAGLMLPDARFRTLSDALNWL